MLTSVIHIRDIALQTKNCFEDKLCPYTLEGRIHMKKTQIIIITIALILTLGCVGTFAVLFFATDIFKSEQKMFYKYISQIDLKEFIDLESYNTYSERLTTAGHANEGEFYIELVNDAETINESVKYDGYSDPVNKTENYDISINKDNDTLLAMNYLRNQDLYGLQFKDVINQYIVVENNNLKEFAAKMGVEDTSQIPNKIEIPESNINYEELNTVLNTYLNIAMQEIPEDNYSKIKKQEISLGDEIIEADGYQVKLKVKDIQRIFIKVLENVKNDETIFNLLNVEGNMAFEDYRAAIDELLVELSEEIPNEENVNAVIINVYKQGKNTVKLSLELEIEEAEVDVEVSIERTAKGILIRSNNTQTNYDETKTVNSITITKAANSEEQENIEIILSQQSEEEKIELMNINISRNGALTSNNVSFIYSLSSNSEPFMLGTENMTLKMQLKTTSNFAGVPKEGKFEQGNHLVINGLVPEQITNLFTNLGSMVGEKLKDEMFVSMIIGFNDSLFDKAEQATQEMQIELEKEQLLSAVIGAMNSNGEIDFTKIELPEGFTESEGVYISKSGNKYTITESGSIIEVGGQEKNPVDYRDPIILDNTFLETQSSNEQSTMSQMFSDGQEFLNN